MNQFEKFAAEMGISLSAHAVSARPDMNADSIKARNIFEACQNTAKTILATIGRENFDRFMNLEEE